MSLKVGSNNIKDIKVGANSISRVYKGSTLIWGYTPGFVIFESSTAGSYTVNIKCKCKVTLAIVGGGSGGTWGWTEQVGSVKQGNSGGYISGTTTISPGNYTVVIGAGGSGAGGSGYQYPGSGGASSFANNVAKGAVAGVAFGGQGSGGTYSISSSGLTGQNGGAPDTTGWINGYGAGGTAGYLSYANPGKAGYVKIVAV